MYVYALFGVIMGLVTPFLDARDNKLVYFSFLSVFCFGVARLVDYSVIAGGIFFISTLMTALLLKLGTRLAGTSPPD